MGKDRCDRGAQESGEVGYWVPGIGYWLRVAGFKLVVAKRKSRFQRGECNKTESEDVNNGL